MLSSRVVSQMCMLEEQDYVTNKAQDSPHVMTVNRMLLLLYVAHVLFACYIIYTLLVSFTDCSVLQNELFESGSCECRCPELDSFENMGVSHHWNHAVHV